MVDNPLNTPFDGLLLAALSMPFLLILVGMVGLKWSALKAGGVAFVASLVILPLVLSVDMEQLTIDILPGSVLEAAGTSLSILWIIFGALCIYYGQLNSGAIALIQQQLARLHPDPKVSALFVAWFFSLFMEGAAGFGTSAALTAPFLVTAGYRPVMAVVLALWGHSLGVAFGAVGTPVITQALLVNEAELVLTRAVLPFMLPTTVLLGIGLAWGCARSAPGHDGITSSSNIMPRGRIVRLGTLAALSFLLPASLLGYWLGPELPTLLGALLGALVFTVLTRRGSNQAHNQKPMAGPFWRAMLPYIILILLVLLTRLLPDIKHTLQAMQWQLEWQGYQTAVAYWYHPGTLLVASFLLGAWGQRQSPRALLSAMGQAAVRVASVWAALFVMLLLSRVLVHTRAIHELGLQVTAVAGAWWPFWAPWFGVLGTFITGSATSSNILFSEFQRSAALASGHPPVPLLGSQTLGAAIGNMVCPHNIIASGATVNIQGDEGQVLKYTLPMATLLTLVAGMLALYLV